MARKLITGSGGKKQRKYEQSTTSWGDKETYGRIYKDLKDTASDLRGVFYTKDNPYLHNNPVNFATAVKFSIKQIEEKYKILEDNWRANTDLLMVELEQKETDFINKINSILTDVKTKEDFESLIKNVEGDAQAIAGGFGVVLSKAEDLRKYGRGDKSLEQLENFNALYSKIVNDPAISVAFKNAEFLEYFEKVKTRNTNLEKLIKSLKKENITDAADIREFLSKPKNSGKYSIEGAGSRAMLMLSAKINEIYLSKLIEKALLSPDFIVEHVGREGSKRTTEDIIISMKNEKSPEQTFVGSVSAKLTNIKQTKERISDTFFNLESELQGTTQGGIENIFNADPQGREEMHNITRYIYNNYIFLDLSDTSLLEEVNKYWILASLNEKILGANKTDQGKTVFMILQETPVFTINRKKEIVWTTDIFKKIKKDLERTVLKKTKLNLKSEFRASPEDMIRLKEKKMKGTTKKGRGLRYTKLYSNAEDIIKQHNSAMASALQISIRYNLDLKGAKNGK